MAKKNSNEISFEINGQNIVIGRRYKVDGRPDEGNVQFKNYNTTKYLMEGISEIRQAPFNEMSQLYETGFQPDEDINKGVSAIEIDKFVEYIKKPFEAKYRVNLDPSNEDFWLKSEYSLVRIYKDREFNTRNIKDLFDLFLCLKHHWIVSPKNKTSNANNVPYTLEDAAEKVDARTKAANSQFDAMIRFQELFKVLDKSDRLYTILEWMGTTSPRKAPKATLEQQIKLQLQSKDFCKKFLEVDSLYDLPTHKTEMELFTSLSILKHNDQIDMKSNKWYLKGVLVGNSLKEGARVAAEGKTERGQDLLQAISTSIEAYI